VSLLILSVTCRLSLLESTFFPDSLLHEIKPIVRKVLGSGRPVWKANVLLLRQTASIPQDALSSSDAYTRTEVLSGDLEEADVAI
jgi:hypothetical protein